MSNIVLGDRVLDVGLSALDTEASRIYICSARPATHADASTALALGYKEFGAGNVFGAPFSGSPDVSGRYVTSNAVVGGNVSTTGVAAFWAVTDDINSRLLATGPITVTGSPAGGDVIAGQTFSMGAITILVPGTAMAASSYHAFAVNFDGSTSFDTNAIGGGLNTNSKFCLWSGWVKPTSFAAARYLVATGFKFDLWIDTNGKITCTAYNAATTQIVLQVANEAVPTGVWSNIAFALNLNGPTIQCYINRVAVTWAGSGILQNDTIDYAANTAGFFAYGASNFLGDAAEFYFNIAETLDLSNSTYLDKFISPGGKPVDLGNGSLPTGSQPLICLNNGTLGTWANNRNTTAGGLTVSAGALTTASTSPSD